jgi:hypothetical protein
MGDACNIRGEEKLRQNLVGNRKRTYEMEGLDVDKRIILK